MTIEPPRKIYIAVPEFKGETEGFYWSAKPLETRPSIPYILKPRWIPVEDGCRERMTTPM